MENDPFIGDLPIEDDDFDDFHERCVKVPEDLGFERVLW